MKINYLKLLFPLLACVLALLTICVCSPIASAHESIYPGARYQPYAPMQRYVPQEPHVNIFQYRNRVFFSQMFVVCHSQINCLTMSNRTNETITLYLNGRWYVAAWSGETFSPTLRWGRNVFVINRFVTLIVVVQQPMRYSWTAQPMQWGWRRF